MCWVLDKKSVDVIWHHDRRDKRKTVSIEMAQRTIYNSRTLHFRNTHEPYPASSQRSIAPVKRL